MAGAPAIRWVEGRCLSYEAALPFHLAIDLLRALLRVGAEATPDELQERLARSCAEYLREGADEVYPFLAHMLGLPLSEAGSARLRYLDAGLLQARYVSAYRIYLGAVARAAPVVVVTDDIQWADHSSVESVPRYLAWPAKRRWSLCW